MKLYKISQETNYEYDTYDSFVVAAKSEIDAETVIPFGSDWVNSTDDIIIEYLGTAKPGTKRGDILGSFNAG